MANNIKETAAEVAALIPQYSWELMDEDQRDALMENVVLPRYMKTTADDIQMGPKFWAGLVGATAEAVRGRVKRLQTSQKTGDGERSAEPKISRAKRAIKQVLREEPEGLDAILDDPEARKAVERALTERQLQEHPATAKRAPTGMPKERAYGFTWEMMDTQNGLLRAIDNYVEAWDRLAPGASEEELSVARDLVAPKLLNLRMTVEGMSGVEA